MLARPRWLAPPTPGCSRRDAALLPVRRLFRREHRRWPNGPCQWPTRWPATDFGAPVLLKSPDFFHPPRRGIRPTVAGKNKWARIEALRRNAAFLQAYREARLEFEDGNRGVVFPLGTYLMVQRFGVAVAKR